MGYRKNVVGFKNLLTKFNTPICSVVLNDAKNPYRGIYYVLDTVLFPTQIIVIRELDKKNHTWLAALTEGMEKQDMKELLEKIDMLTQKVDKELADSVLEVSIRANWSIVEELRGDESMCQALLEIMEPEINKIVKTEVEAKTQEVILLAIKGYHDLGASDEKIREILMGNYEFSYEQAETYLKEYYAGNKEE